MSREELDTNVCGIPCIVRVTHFYRNAGSYSYNAPSDLDYYGYTEMDYDILDRRGRPAPWLERKLNDAVREEIEAEIYTHMIDNRDY